VGADRPALLKCCLCGNDPRHEAGFLDADQGISGVVSHHRLGRLCQTLTGRLTS
jgi:hypothetical protein